MIVAIDGPAGTGKSTIAKLIAEKLNITFLNSGSFYRGITLSLLRNNTDLNSVEDILKVAESLDMQYEKNSHLLINGEDVTEFLHSDEVDAHAAQISAIVPLRHIVNAKLRKITEKVLSQN